jgi:hypothetical protein
MGRTCGTYGGEERCIQGLVGKPGGRRPLGRPRRRWEDNIKMNLRDVEWGGIDWNDLAQDRARLLCFSERNCNVVQTYITSAKVTSLAKNKYTHYSYRKQNYTTAELYRHYLFLIYLSLLSLSLH